MLTHNVKNMHISEPVIKTKFDKFKDFVKEKALLIAFPVALTFSVPTYAQAQELTLNYKHENTEKEIEIQVTNKMKEIYLNYENKKIDETKLKAQLFKEVYAQLKSNETFPVTKLSDIVNELIFELSDMDLKPVTITKKKKITPKKVEIKEEITQENKDLTTKTIEEEKEIKAIPEGKEQEFVENFVNGQMELEKIAKETQQDLLEENVANVKKEIEKIETAEKNGEVKEIILEENNTFEKYKKEMNITTEVPIQKNEEKNEKKTKWKFTFEGDVSNQKNSVPSLDDSGIVNSIIDTNIGIKAITKSGFGIELIGGYSGEIVYLTNEIQDTRNTDNFISKNYSADNHLGKMQLGFSYNNDDITVALLGGYKLGKLYADNKLERDSYYPILAFNLESYKNNYTKLKIETPILFNEGQNLTAAFDHSSKYILTSFNAQYSRQSTTEKTALNNTINNVYQILNNQNMLGVNLYNFKVEEGFIAPTLFLVGNVNYLNAEGLQKITTWSLGPGLGFNYIYKNNPVFSLGYGYGMGKLNMQFTDLEGQNSYNLKSPYSTHNVFIRLNAPLSENSRICSEFMYVKSDGKGKEGIENPIADYTKFLLLFNYTY